MKNIFLIGFMGTGKTSVGKKLARDKQWQFVDLDDRIEAKEKRKIADIFTQDGEPYFRQVEKQVLREVSLGSDLVVACGGGIVIDTENIQIMKKAGILVCLTAPAEVIIERTKGFAHRPLLNVPDPKEKIESLLKQRLPSYKLADVCVDTSGVSVGEVAEKISRIIKDYD
ncbi:MAG: shikimate kinase [Candidatus Omnitrophota bacterium]|jgi:shikimate kinase